MTWGICRYYSERVVTHQPRLSAHSLRSSTSRRVRPPPLAFTIKLYKLIPYSRSRLYAITQGSDWNDTCERHCYISKHVLCYVQWNKECVYIPCLFVFAFCIATGQDYELTPCSNIWFNGGRLLSRTYPLLFRENVQIKVRVCWFSIPLLPTYQMLADLSQIESSAKRFVGMEWSVWYTYEPNNNHYNYLSHLYVHLDRVFPSRTFPVFGQSTQWHVD